jgi:hypothetical protein
MRALTARSALLVPILSIALVASGCDAPTEAVAADTQPAPAARRTGRRGHVVGAPHQTS